MRKLVGAVIMALAFASVSRADDQADALAIVDKAIKARGGEEKLAKQPAMTWKDKGKFHLAGMEVSYEAQWSFQAPDKSHAKFSADFGGMTIEAVQVVSGNNAWETVNGMEMELTEEKLTERKQGAYVMWVQSLAPLKDKEFTLKAIGEIKAGDRPALGVLVQRKDRRDIKLFFDKETGLLAKSEYRVRDDQSGMEVNQEVLYSDYKEIDGVKYFTKMKIHRDGNLLIDTELSEQKPVEKLDEKLFAKP